MFCRHGTTDVHLAEAPLDAMGGLSALASPCSGRRAAAGTPRWEPLQTASKCRPVRTGFTLVEALVALAIAAVAGSALLLGATSSLHTTGQTLQQTVAQGMAQQTLDEVVGNPYDGIDDFDGLRRQPPTDCWGVALGTEDVDGGQRDPNFRVPTDYFSRWRQEVDVYCVDPSDLAVRLPSGQVSDYRAVEVRIVDVDPDRGPRILAKLRRVVAYVPPLQ